jgi:co-chaperonin GroES (HSP10)
VQGRGAMIRIVRHIMPLGPRVLVKIIALGDRAESGLYLPQGAKERTQEALYGEVIEVARAEPTDPEQEGFGVNVAGVPHGAKVIFGKTAGVKVPWGRRAPLARNEVLATVDEIREDELS